MIETGLIVAQVVFLLLLYLFVWRVVRSSSRQMDPKPAKAPAPERAPSPARGRRRRTQPMGAPAPALPRALPVPDAPGPQAHIAGNGTQNTAETPAAPEAVPAGSDEAEGRPARERARAGAERRLDLAANISPRLVVERSQVLEVGEERTLDSGLTIGRSSSSGLTIGDPFVSHMHARIMRRGPFLFVQDLGSTNGTFLNDRRVEGDAQLRVRDELRIGDTVLRYEE